MKNISLRLPDKLLADLDLLIEEGYYSNRTEALREAARLLLRSQVGSLKGQPVQFSKDEIWSEFKEENHIK
jgi:Arc/MetJ-type ribon-helix-helix transcriptional regulator